MCGRDLVLAAVMSLMVAGGSVMAEGEAGNAAAGADATAKAGADGGGGATGVDRYGDPLPSKDCIARLGTLRMRHEGVVSYVKFTPDGRGVLAVPYNGTPTIWNYETGAAEHVLADVRKRLRYPDHVAFSPDGKVLAIASSTGTFQVGLWSAETGKFLRLLKTGKLKTVKKPLGAKTEPAFSPDGKWLAWACGREVGVWQVATGKLVHTLGPPAEKGDQPANAPPRRPAQGQGQGQGQNPDRSQVLGQAFSPDGKSLVAGWNDGRVMIWKTADWTVDERFAAGDSAAVGVRYLPDGKALAWRTLNGLVVVRDLDSGKHREFSTGGSTDFVITPDGKKLIAILSNGFVRAWRLSDGEQLYGRDEAEKAIRDAKQQLGGFVPAAYYYAMDISPDGKVLVTSSGAFARIGAHAPVFRDAATGEIIDRGAETWRIMGVRYLDPDRIETRAYDGTIRTLDVDSGKPLSAQSNINTNRLAVSDDGSLAVWQTVGGIRIDRKGNDKPVKRGTATAFSAAVSPDNALVAVNVRAFGKMTSELLVLDASSGEKLTEVNMGRSASMPLAFIDERTVVFATGNPNGKGAMVYRLDARTGDIVGRLAIENTLRLAAMAVSPDRRVLAIGAHNQIELFETATFERIHTLRGHSSQTKGLAFGPDSLRLVAGDWAGNVRVWDVFQGKVVQEMAGHEMPVNCVAYAPDGKTVASGSWDTTVLVWSLDRVQRHDLPATSEQKLTEAVRDWLWADMNAEALLKVIGGGDRSVELLARAVRPVKVDAALRKRLADIIRRLDADDYETRGEAARELADIQRSAAPLITEALEESKSVEVRARLQQWLADKDADIEAVRAIHALEKIATPDARALLEKFASGEPKDRLAIEARASLSRLGPAEDGGEDNR